MAIIGSEVSKAAEIIRNGGLVAIPTETVYGLAANALNMDAVTKIFKAKNRPFFDPLIIHISSTKEVLNYVSEFSVLAQNLANKFWPGPLSMVLPKLNIINDLITSGNKGVAIRVPSHPLTLQLLKLANLPLAAPSANPFGYVSPTTAHHVNQQLGNEVDYILDGGPCNVGLESTVVSFMKKNPVILRLGGLKIDELKHFIPNIDIEISSHSNPLSPGQTDKHYSPTTKFILFEKITPDIINSFSGKVGCIYFSNPLFDIKTDIKIILSETGNTDEAAKNLFSALRKADEANFDILIAEKAPEFGLGLAINDRLNRAAHN